MVGLSPRRHTGCRRRVPPVGLAAAKVQLPALARTALDVRTAEAALRRGRRLLGAGLGFPYFSELALQVEVSACHDAASGDEMAK